MVVIVHCTAPLHDANMTMIGAHTLLLFSQVQCTGSGLVLSKAPGRAHPIMLKVAMHNLLRHFSMAFEDCALLMRMQAAPQPHDNLHRLAGHEMRVLSMRSRAISRRSWESGCVQRRIRHACRICVLTHML